MPGVGIIITLFFPLAQVNTYIEDCIAKKDPLIKILRLVCLQSVCNTGLKQKVLDYYKKEIVQVNDCFIYWILHLQVTIVSIVSHSKSTEPCFFLEWVEGGATAHILVHAGHMLHLCSESATRDSLSPISSQSLAPAS